MKWILTFLLFLSITFSYAVKPPYILHVEGAPGVCQFWFYDTDGTIIPLLYHQIKNNQYMNYPIVKKKYRIRG